MKRLFLLLSLPLFYMMRLAFLLFLWFFSTLFLYAQEEDQLRKWVENGITAYNQGDYKEAIVFLEKIEIILDENSKGLVRKNKEHGDILYLLAESNDQIGYYGKAVEYGKRVVDIYKTTIGDNHADYATSLQNLANYYYDNEDYTSAIKYGIEAMTKRKAILGEKHPDYGQSLYNLSSFYSSSGDYTNAVEYGIKAMEVTKTTLGEKHPNYAMLLCDIAYYYSFLGKYAQAVELEEKAQKILKETLGENSSDYAISLNNLVTDYTRLGDYTKAVELGEEALDILRETVGENHPDYGNTLDNLSITYSSLGDYSKALDIGTKALEIQKKALGEKHIDCAIILNNLASYYFHLGDYSKAVEFGEKALEIQRETVGENHPDYARYLSNIAHYYSSHGESSKALDCYTQAMEIRKSTLGEQHALYAVTIAGLSDHFFSIGDYPKALDFGIKALEIQRRTLGENHPDYAATLSVLAKTYYIQGNIPKAMEMANKAFAIRKDVFGENHPVYAGSLEQLSAFYYFLNEPSNALNMFTDYIALSYTHILYQFNSLTSHQRQSLWRKATEKFTDVYPALFYKTSTQSASDLYNKSALFAKGLLLTTEIEMSRLIQETGDDKALHMFEELRFKRMDLQKLYEKPIAERYVNTDSLKAVADHLEKELVERSKVYGDYTKKLQTTWKDVQQSLADDELAVEFLSFNVYGTDSTMVAALTLRKDATEPKLYPLFELRQLKELSDTVTFICPNLTSLVWQPLHDELKGIKTIYFSPAGVLHKIGIEYAPGMESYEMFRLSSTREIIDMKALANTTEEWSASLYGGINYESSNPTKSAENKTVSDASLKYSISQHRAIIDSLDIRGMQIDYLPGTLREVQSIEHFLKGSHHNATIYIGSEATETSVKSSSGKKIGILHISTHGFYYTESQAKKKEKLRFLSFDDKHQTNYEDKTLTRSGLLMAGAKLTIDGKDVPMDSDDGILTAQEISMLDLRGTDLVVLSACETARGDIMQGEGVFGLQRGFKKAGAKSILMSLWKVSDVSTEILMTEFYKNLCNGKSKRESLRLAQKIVREYKDSEGNYIFQDPHYWAGFVMLD